jgi:EmrB/QacA subfamily drug resistance transporter
MPSGREPEPTPVALGSAAGRWTMAASVLGSGAAFVESSVVNVALPAIARDLGLGMSGMQWVLNAYLLALSALMLLGGALGDRVGRREVFALGLVAFAAGSLLCAAAPAAPWLVGARLLQGAAAALLVPNSLALLEHVIRPEDHGAAIGTWAGWSAVTTALGPLVGGALVDAASWRLVFACIVPLALAAAWIARRRIPAERRSSSREPLDVGGTVLVSAGLSGVTYALVAGPDAGWMRAPVLAAGAGGVLALALFVLVERRRAAPLLPPDLFRSRQFAGANLATLLVYAALSGVMLFLVLVLQQVFGWSALAAGAALLPMNALMLVGSPAAGRLVQRVGARGPMTVGALGAAAGMVLLSRMDARATYVADVLPGLLVFGAGLATLVAPLTAAVLDAVPGERAGLASAVNNAMARLASLLAVAVLPLVAGVGGAGAPERGELLSGSRRAMVAGATLCALGALVAWRTVRGGPTAVEPRPHPSGHGCLGSRRAATASRPARLRTG